MDSVCIVTLDIQSELQFSTKAVLCYCIRDRPQPTQPQVAIAKDSHDAKSTSCRMPTVYAIQILDTRYLQAFKEFVGISIDSTDE